METTLNKQSKPILSDNAKGIIVDIISYLFVALFIYTAASKIMTFDSFEVVLGRSPLIGEYNKTIAWIIPIIEILISVILIIPKLNKLGLYASLFLMTIFTVYLIYMIFSGSTLPCHCGGVISSMTWNQHIWFNAFFIILALSALLSYKK